MQSSSHAWCCLAFRRSHESNCSSHRLTLHWSAAPFHVKGKKRGARIRNSRKAKRGTEHQRAEEMRVEKAGGPVSDSMETNDPPEQEGIVQVLPSTFSSFCDARGFHMQIALDAEACVRAPCPPDYREGGVFTPHPFFSENCPSTPQLSARSLALQMTEALFESRGITLMNAFLHTCTLKPGKESKLVSVWLKQGTSALSLSNSRLSSRSGSLFRALSLFHLLALLQIPS